MNLTVKTLKGGKFTIEIDPTQTIAQTKSIIENTKSELGSASSMKLIHSGKVLKDNDTIESCNIKPSDFLVVMITKAKKEKAPAPAAATAASATETTTAAATSSTETATAAPPAAATAATTSTTESTSSTENNNSNNNNDEFPAEIMANLRALGFPESDILVCLRASNGNPDVAVEFLMNGIPPGIAAAAGGGGGAGGGGANSGGAASSSGANNSSTSTTTGGGGPLEALRQHPQFNDIRRLVQTNPQMLSAVLQQIGGQQPELLSAINANQSEFLAMMNEPIAEGTGSGGSGGGSGGGGAEAAGSPASGGALGAGLGGVPGMEALGNPAQLAAMLQSMPPQEQQAMASMMGMTVDQL
jgi:UV excision repair protein RAD23